MTRRRKSLVLEAVAVAAATAVVAACGDESDGADDRTTTGRACTLIAS